MGRKRWMKVARSGSRWRGGRSLSEDQQIPQAPFGDARWRQLSTNRRCHVEKGDDRAGVACFAHATAVRSLVVLSRRDGCRVRLRRPRLHGDMQDARHRKRKHTCQPHDACSLLTKTCESMERGTQHGRIHAASRERYTITLGRLRRSVLNAVALGTTTAIPDHT